MTTWDPAGPLPTGTAVLEASAGTGKTYAIAALAARYLAEGVVSADRLAVISFSRMASAELRSRVRDRLRRSLDVLTGALAGSLDAPPDATDALLLAAPREEVQSRIMRLRRAIAGLDAASIMTIHQFCQAMLDELGVLATADPQATLTEDLSLLLDQVVDDLYLARYARSEQGPPFGLETARALARSAVELPVAPLRPEAADGRAAERVAFAAEARAELDRRKRRLGLYSFDDQLLRLRDSLRGVSGQAAAERLRRRCQVVLVDEFQDTDPVQHRHPEALPRGHGHREAVERVVVAQGDHVHACPGGLGDERLRRVRAVGYRAVGVEVDAHPRILPARPVPGECHRPARRSRSAPSDASRRATGPGCPWRYSKAAL